MRSKKSKIEQLPKSCESRFLAASAAASLCRTCTKLCDRSLVIRWSVTLARAGRTSGVEKSSSPARKYFFDSIGHYRSDGPTYSITSSARVGRAGGMLSRRCSGGRLRPGRPLEVDHKIARDRHRITFGRQQYLKHHVRAMQEFEFDGGEIEFPHPAEPFVVDRSSPGSIFGEALAPVFHRVVIMQP